MSIIWPGIDGAGAIPVSLMGGAAPGFGYILRFWMDASTPAQGYADAQVLDTKAEGRWDGQLTVVEQDGTLAVNASGECAFTAQATPVWGDLGAYSQAITRVLGRGLIITVTYGAANKFLYLGWQSAPNVGLAAQDAGVISSNLGELFTREGGASGPVVAVYTAAEYQYAFVLGGYDINGVPWRQGEPAANYLYGASIYGRGGVYTAWALLWRIMVSNTSPLYAVFSSNNALGTIEKLRVPDVDLSAVLQPTALSTFTAANGTSLDAITPEVGGTWTEQSGNFDIQSNRANISVSTGSRDVSTTEDGIADGVFDVVVRKTAAVDSGEFGRCLRHTDANNYWMVNADLTNNQIELVERNGGVENVRASAAVTLTHSVDYDVRAIAYGQTIDIFLDGGNKATYALAVLNENATRHGIVGNETSQTFNNCASYPRTSTVYDGVLGGV